MKELLQIVILLVLIFPFKNFGMFDESESDYEKYNLTYSDINSFADLSYEESGIDSFKISNQNVHFDYDTQENKQSWNGQEMLPNVPESPKPIDDNTQENEQNLNSQETLPGVIELDDNITVTTLQHFGIMLMFKDANKADIVASWFNRPEIISRNEIASYIESLGINIKSSLWKSDGKLVSWLEQNWNRILSIIAKACNPKWPGVSAYYKNLVLKEISSSEDRDCIRKIHDDDMQDFLHMYLDNIQFSGYFAAYFVWKYIYMHRRLEINQIAKQVSAWYREGVKPEHISQRKKSSK